MRDRSHSLRARNFLEGITDNHPTSNIIADPDVAVITLTLATVLLFIVPRRKLPGESLKKYEGHTHSASDSFVWNTSLTPDRCSQTVSFHRTNWTHFPRNTKLP